ncbi:unnamed protein product [Lactuca saligna]|uniref:Uncharacterized protein n=1 Tax=Lactuca saligna TaxID=75948 RepID=A0AA35ZV34_LACSI|nr:unnamed protein product [Lactuca saligna]
MMLLPQFSESGDQDGGPSRSSYKTPKKTPNGRQHKIQAKEDLSLTYDEDFDDLFTYTPNDKQPMSQEKEDVQEKENANEVKVNERDTLKELLLSKYTHVDAVDAIKEVSVVTLFRAFIL